MVILDLTAIRALMLRTYAQCKQRAALVTDRQSLIQQLAQAASDRFAPAAAATVVPSASSATAAAITPATGSMSDAATLASTLLSIFRVIAEELVNTLEPTNLTGVAALKVAPRDRVCMRAIAKDAAIGSFAALCARGWGAEQILSTLDKAAERALVLIHQRVTFTNARLDRAFVSCFIATLAGLASAVGTLDLDAADDEDHHQPAHPASDRELAQ